LRKWWWLVLIATLVAGVSSYFAASQQPDKYRSSATLIVGSALFLENPTAQDINISQQLTDFYVSYANRGSTRDAAKQALQVQCGCDFVWPEILVFRSGNLNVIEIVVEDTNPELAQAVAGELANQVLLKSPTAKEQDSAHQQFLSEQLDGLQHAIRQLEDQLVIKREELGEAVSAREIALIQSEISALEVNISTLQGNYGNLLDNLDQKATNTVEIFEPASPAWLVTQSKLVTIATAAGIGLVLAASAAYLLEYLDDSVQTPEQVNRLTGSSTLAGIGAISEDEDKLITLAKPRSPISEAFRVLRTAIQFSTMDSHQRSLLVTSALPNEGKTTIAANLAVVMAQAGRRVLLIDADLRRPSQHKIFDLPNRRGLTSLLLDYSQHQEEEDILRLVEEVVQPTPVAGLYLLTCGFIPPNPSELLGSVKMKALLDELAKRFDFLVVDSAPLLAVTDSAILSTQVDSTLLVVRAGKSRKGHLRQAAQRLQEVGGKMAGCILNELSNKSEGYGMYYYYQESEYEEKGKKSKTSGKSKLYRPLRPGRFRKPANGRSTTNTPQEEFEDTWPG
jgi:non-specific protein-tyrosine kinase